MAGVWGGSAGAEEREAHEMGRSSGREGLEVGRIQAGREAGRLFLGHALSQPARPEDVVAPRVASGPEQRAEEVNTRPHPWAGS